MQVSMLVLWMVIGEVVVAFETEIEPIPNQE
jgi:hypothetical protein